MKKEKNNQKFGYLIKIIVFILSLFSLIMSLFTIIDCFKNQKYETDIKYIYDIKNDLEYKVHLYENSFFEEPYLEMDKNYTAKLIKNIDVEYTSDFNISKYTNMTYDYMVKATINGKYQNNNNGLDNSLWTREYTIVDYKNVVLSNKTENVIKIPVTIEYPFYKNYVTEFQKQMRLDIDAVLDVILYINYTFYVDGDKVMQDVEMHLNIPLTDPIFEISKNIPDPVHEVVFAPSKLKLNKVKLFGSIALFLGSLIGFVLLFNLTFKIKKKSIYEQKIKRIFKDYGDIIAETINLPNLEESEILDIKEFVDLVDIEEELKIPIIYYQKVKNKEGWFILIHGKHIYRYILKVNKK